MLEKNHSSLKGKSIIIVRAQEQTEELRNLFESYSAKVVCIPPVEIREPDSWNECDNVIWKLAEYQGVCFTSKNAVNKFVERIRIIRPQAVDTLSTRNIYAIGKATQIAIESSGFPIIVAAEDLQNLTSKFQSHKISGEKILLLKGQTACNALSKQLLTLGATIEEVTVYKLVIAESGESNLINELLTKGTIDIIMFFSPSSALNFTELLTCDNISKTTVAGTNTITINTLNQLGFNSIIEIKQTKPEDIVKSILKHLEIEQQ